LEHTNRTWLRSTQSDANSPATPSPARLILDACRNRFQLAADSDPKNASASGSVAASAGVIAAPSVATSLSSQRNTAAQQLTYDEIHSLAKIRRIIEGAAAEMHKQFEAEAARSDVNGAAATAATTKAATAAAAFDPYSLAMEDDTADSFPCTSVTVLIDDLVSLLVRFGASRTLAFLQALKSSPQQLALIAAVDLDGLAVMAPLQVGSGTGNEQAAHTAVSIHAHLAALASTTVSIRALRTAQGGDGSNLLATVHVTHRRTSGRMAHVVEEVEIQPTKGVVRKITAAATAAAAAASASSTATPSADSTAASSSSAAGAASSSSLAAQFGSSFSLDLTSKARSARAQTVLPYQHTGGDGASGVSSIDAEEELDDLLSDEDLDADDPDDDLDV
jgi:hypothetical protein